MTLEKHDIVNRMIKIAARLARGEFVPNIEGHKTLRQVRAEILHSEYDQKSLALEIRDIADLMMRGPKA